MEYHPTESEVKIIRDLIDILDRMGDSRGPATELETTIAQARQGPLNGAIAFALQQLECLYGLYKSELAGCFDTSPAVSFEDKKRQIKNALSELLKGNVIDFSFFEHHINRIRRHDETIAVEELCRRDWEYSIFRGVEKGEYYLQIQKDASGASRSETKLIDADKAKTLIDDPDGGKALAIFAASNSEEF
jgi:hypothetical protein